MKNQHKNFTLVELAVIIFCCAAITAVTLPLAHGTVEQAKRITCMNIKLFISAITKFLLGFIIKFSQVTLHHLIIILH